MADRAEMFALSTFHSLSPPGCRPSQEISLEEFDDEDLSEITDDCGIGLNYDSDHYEKFQDQFVTLTLLQGLQEQPDMQNLDIEVTPDMEIKRWKESAHQAAFKMRRKQRHDYLVLEKCEQFYPVCTFKDDFQGFEMIDDNEEEEEEEEEGKDLEEMLPFSLLDPSLTPEVTKKHQPPTLNLIATGTQDSLNNNSSSCKSAALLMWTTKQKGLLHPISSISTSHAEQPSPSHACLQDGSCLDTWSSQGLSPAQVLCKPHLYDAEDNSQALYGPLTAEQSKEDYNMNIVSPVSHSQPPFAGRAPTEHPNAPEVPVIGSECKPPNVSPHKSPTTDSNCARFQMDELGSKIKEVKSPVGCTGGKAGQGFPIALTELGSSPLSGEKPTNGYGDTESAGQHSLEVHFSPTLATRKPQSSGGEGFCGGQAVSQQGLPPTSSDTTSPSSDPGIEADLISHNLKACSRHCEDLSVPGSDSDPEIEGEGEIEMVFTCNGNCLTSNMISSISETELDLSSDSSSGRSSHLTNSIEETSSPGSEAELVEALHTQGVMGLKDILLLDTDKAEEELEFPIDENLAALKIEELYEDPSTPTGQTNVPTPGPLELEINPDHSLESLRHSFYLPVGPKHLPEGNDEANSEYDSESDTESEPDMSENSDSPWLLSNLVNKMISEGSFPLKYADECFPVTHSIADTISPASDLESEIPSETLSMVQPCSQQSIELVDMETLRCSLQSAEEEKPMGTESVLGYPMGHSGTYLFLSNPTNDTITPVFPGRPLSSCCENLPAQSLPSREAPSKDKPAAVPEDWMVEGDIDSGILEDNDMIDDIRLQCSESLDISSTKTNCCFSLVYSPEEDEEPRLDILKSSPFSEELLLPPPAVLDDSLAYDFIKYTLVVDENTQLELVSLKRCTSVLSDDSELLQACETTNLEDAASDFGEVMVVPDRLSSSSEDSSPEADLHFSKKFLNVFVNSTSRSSSTESFGLFSCMVNGEEQEQTHRAVFRFIPRHEDELELDVDDPILVELEEDDYWYRGYNMRTGERGIFPAFYAHEVMCQGKDITGPKWNPCRVEHFNVQFLGSVEVPYHQGNGILCAAMQKIAATRKLTVHLRPPAICDLEVSLQGIKLILTVNEYSQDEESEHCSHFFQMKNISFCGCHPRNSCYFGFITKHPMLSRFACHVFVSQESMRHVAECVGHAFLEYYQEHLEFACPTEDIYLE